MADFEIRINDHSGEVMKQFNANLQVALEAIGIQAESHAKQIITDTLVYGGIDLMVKGEKDNSRVDTGAMRNSVAHAVHGKDVYIGSNLPYAPYHELGTGIYASQPGGRRTPWSYADRNGVWHTTRGLQPIHFLLKAASEYNDEYKAIIQRIMEGH